MGNSHTVLGIFKGDKVVDHWRLTTRKETTSDEVMNRIGGLIRFSEIKPSVITHVGLSTVVPVLERPWIKALQTLLKRPVQVVSSKNCLDCPIAYPNPATLGSDRLCNVIALRDRGYKDAIVVDMGTATTFDVMKDGVGCMGNSGGGTMTAILGALDPRVVAACPSCYIGSLRTVVPSTSGRNISQIGDAEQNGWLGPHGHGPQQGHRHLRSLFDIEWCPARGAPRQRRR